VKRTIIPLLLALTSLLLTISCGSSGQLRSDPKSSVAYHYNLGMAEFEKGNYKEALKHFERAIRLNPDIARIYNEIGTCHLFLKDNSKAIPYFEKAITLDPEMAEAHNSLGIALFGLGRLSEAEMHFQATLASPDYGTQFLPLYNLGNIYLMQERYDIALEYYNKALAEESKITAEYRINIHHRLADTYYKMGNYSDAMAHYDKVIVLSPMQVDALYYAGECALKLGDNDKARALLAKVTVSAPGTEWETKAIELMEKLKQ
jgi:type IV pilus biogenesis/stability protein PilW